jgi:hypothetical protein
MASSDVYVSFGADTGGLEAALALTKAQVQATQAELNKLGREMQKTGADADSALASAMVFVANDLTKAKAAAANLSAELKTLGTAGASSANDVANGFEQSVKRVGEAAGHGGHGTIFGIQSGVFLELRALLDEALSGRMRNFEGSFARLIGMTGQSIVGFVTLNPMIAALGTAAAVSAGYLAYLAVQMVKVGEAKDTIQRGSAFSGNFNIVDPKTLDETRQKLETLKGLFHGIGEDDVANITVEFARMGDASNVVIKAMADDMKYMWKGFGEKEDEASKNLVKLFSEPLAPIDQIAKGMNGLSDAERKLIADAQRAGDPLRAQAAIQDVIAQRAENYHSARIQQIDAEIAKDRERQATTLAGDQQTRHALQDEIDILEKEKAQTQAIDANLAGWAGKIAAAVGPAQNLEAAFRSLMRETLPQVGELENVRLKIAQIKSQMAQSTQGPFGAVDDNRTQELSTALNEQIAKEQQLAGVVAGGTELEKVRLKNLQDEVARRGDNATAARNELAAINAEIEAAKKEGGSPTLSKLTEQANAQKKVYEADYASFKDADDLKVKAAGKNSAEVIAIREQELAKARELFRSDSAQVVAAERELASAKEQAANRGAAAGAKAAKDELGATIAGLNDEVAEAEKTTRAKVALYAKEQQAKQITEAQKVALTLAALKQGETAELAALNRELARGDLPLKERQPVLDKEKDLQLDYALAVDKINEDAAAKATQSWDSAMKTINGAFTSQINGLLTGTETWSKALKNVLTSLTEDVIKFFVNWGLEAVENEAKQILLGNAIVAAHAAGDATMAAADQSAGAAGALGWIGTAIKSIEASAAQTFAGVTGFMAPIVGPAAPAAGAAAEATVLAAAGGIGMMDIGAWNIPSDQLAMVHKGEMVATPSQAAGLRSLVENGGSQSRGGDVHTHLNMQIATNDAGSFAKSLHENSDALLHSISEAMRRGGRSGMRKLARQF